RTSWMPRPNGLDMGIPTDRPAKFHRLDIFPDALPILSCEPFQPISDGLSARLGPEENRRSPFTLAFKPLGLLILPRRWFGPLTHRTGVPYKVQLGRTGFQPLVSLAR